MKMFHLPIDCHILSVDENFSSTYDVAVTYAVASTFSVASTYDIAITYDIESTYDVASASENGCHVYRPQVY